MRNRKTHNGIKYFVVAFLLLFCEWFFFRNVIGTDEIALIGDRSDGRLTMLLTEHWWNFFNGKERFSELAMFYPADDVIGYTDLFLGYGIIHSFFRLIGFNMYVAYKWTVMSVHLVGTFSMFYLMNKKLKCNVGWSLFGTMAFSFSDTYARFLAHTQLGAVSALPILLIFFLGFIENFEERKKRNIYAYLFIVWFVLLTYNSWYVACFTGIFCLVFLIVYYINLRCAGIKPTSLLLEKVRYIGRDIIGYIVSLIVLYIPFIKIYIPVLRSSSGYTYKDCAIYLPEFADIINVTDGNYMLGKFIEILGLSDRGYTEVSEGYSIVLLTMFLVCFFVNRKHAKKYDKNNEMFGAMVPNAVFVSVLICLALILRLSANGVSLWAIVYYILPIVRSVRAIARFMLWLSFPIAVITAYMSQKYIKLDTAKRTTLLNIALLLILFVSNINTVGASSSWSYKEETDFVSAVAEPPADAESFYIIDTADEEDEPFIYQLDAYEIAEVFSLKTINGYSGQMPQDWERIWAVSSVNYEVSVFDWVEGNGLENVYAYDRAENEWTSIAERKAELLDDAFCPAENKFSITTGLKDNAEQGEYVWSGLDFNTRIVNSEIKEKGLYIKLRSELSSYMSQNPELEPYIQIYVNGELVDEVEPVDDYMEFKIPVESYNTDTYDIEIKTNCYFIPNEIGTGEDGRDLSLAIYYIGTVDD